MLSSESQFVSHLSIHSTLQLHSTTVRFPFSFGIFVRIIMIVKSKGFMNVPRRQVNVCRRQFSCIKANMRFTMPYNCSGCWMGWGGVWVNILGVFNMLWHNCENNKPMFEFAKLSQFYRVSLNRCLQTSIFPHRLQGSTIRRS